MPTPQPHRWLSQLRSRFIVFDGPDGSGKTTQFRRFVHTVEQAGLTICQVREPGGTPIGEQIRKILLDPANTDMNMRCEMLLYMASRAQLIAQRIAPARQQQQLIVADRFISSTLAYQGTAGGIPVADILRVGQIALGQHWPDLVVVFDVDQHTAHERMNPLLRGREFDADLDRIENKGHQFWQTVRNGYLDQAHADPRRYLVIDATADADAVFDRLLNSLRERAAQW